jgi:hypothetical protein
MKRYGLHTRWIDKKSKKVVKNTKEEVLNTLSSNSLTVPFSDSKKKDLDRYRL